jgi:hypothetical protein
MAVDFARLPELLEQDGPQDDAAQRQAVSEQD